MSDNTSLDKFMNRFKITEDLIYYDVGANEFKPKASHQREFARTVTAWWIGWTAGRAELQSKRADLVADLTLAGYQNANHLDIIPLKVFKVCKEAIPARVERYTIPVYYGVTKHDSL